MSPQDPIERNASEWSPDRQQSLLAVVAGSSS
jgi:hypothetical protein